jgi:hypothetical protein
MPKIFIHPDLLVNVKRNIFSNQEEKLDSLKYEKAKKEGEDFANEILNQLFKKQEYGNIESHFNTERLNSDNFTSVREQIIKLHFQRKFVTEEANIFAARHKELTHQLDKTQNSFFKFLYKKKIIRLKNEVEQVMIDLEATKEVERESYLNISYTFDSTELKDKYSDLISAFTALKSSQKIWDMTYSERNLETKAAAHTSMQRNEVKFSYGSIDVIQTTEKSFWFENFNGGDFYFYPSFILYFKSKEDIAILDYNDLHVNYTDSKFLEENNEIPSDSKVIGETWYRVNKDGTPDKRFVNNYKMPIVLYGSLHLKTESGINELYYISDATKAKHFSDQYKLYQSLLKNMK